MKRNAAKIVHKLLNFEQKLRLMEMLTTFRDGLDLLKKVITDDKSWAYSYDIETKAQSSQWKRQEDPRPKKANQIRSNVNVLFTFFCIMNFYHKVVRSIRNTTLKLGVRDAQNYGKTNHGFFTMITHHRSH